eukprot:763961-Hanusia_phi.AAC.1
MESETDTESDGDSDRDRETVTEIYLLGHTCFCKPDFDVVFLLAGQEWVLYSSSCAFLIRSLRLPVGIRLIELFEGV